MLIKKLTEFVCTADRKIVQINENLISKIEKKWSSDWFKFNLIINSVTW